MAIGAAVRDLEQVFHFGTVAGLSEGQLVERFAKRGDEAAFEALVHRHGPMVMGVCRRILRDPNDVEDAFQATFLVLVRKAGSLKQSDLLGNWLYGVATKVAYRSRSLSSKRRVLEFSKGVAQPAESSELRSVSDENSTLHEELRRLPEKYRTAVVLCYLEGLTHEQAAERLEWPVGTVKGRLSRARDLLKSRLSRRGIALATPLAIVELFKADSHAAVPAATIHAALKAAALAKTGKPIIAGVISAEAIALSQGVVKSMSLTKIKLAASTFALAGTLLTSAGVFGYQGTGPQVVNGSAGASASSGASAATATSATKNEQGGSAASGSSAAPANRTASGTVKADATGASSSGGGSVSSSKAETSAPQQGGGAGAAPPAGGGNMGAGGGFGGGPGGGFGGSPGMGMGMGGAGGADESGVFQKMRLVRIRSKIAEAAPKMAELDKTPGTQVILKKLDQAIALNFTEDTPLQDVLDYIKKATQSDNDSGIAVYVDPVGLAEAEQTMTSAVKINMEGVPLKTSLRLLLKQLGLAYCVKEGLLFISNPEGVIDELREFESANVPEEQRSIGLFPERNFGGVGMAGGMGGGFR